MIKPYGDTMGDGKVQLSFSLPVAAGAHGIECAREIARQMGLPDPAVVDCEPMGEGFSHYVIYGMVPYGVDPDTIRVRDVDTPVMSMEEIEQLIEDKLGRDIVFVGASTGSDAHTVGIDAIMNMKGFAGHYGLERYKHVKAYNMGSQVPNEAFIKKAREVNADVLLVSQTVTQKDVHLHNLVELVNCWKPKRCATRSFWCAAAPASPTNWPRSWATTPASAQRNTPRTSPVSPCRS